MLEKSRYVYKYLMLAVTSILILNLILFRVNHTNKHLKERLRKPNIIVAHYIGAGNLLEQLSPGIFFYYWFLNGDGLY